MELLMVIDVKEVTVGTTGSVRVIDTRKQFSPPSGTSSDSAIVQVLVLHCMISYILVPQLHRLGLNLHLIE